MDYVLSIVADASRWCRGHLGEIALALISTLLVMFGTEINGWVKQRLGSLPTLVRVPALAAATVAIYGAATTHLTPWVVKGLGQFNNYSLAPVLLIGVCLLGVLAERR
ncbi:uncharacterized protein DUF3392 [Pseudomonas duriflava]|uniref:Uncharacterized protein DUF3392 n=1 Tax=Pseudomonas duriflava TaxID=459528 RepID=A0A562QNW7_9PSED|nr:DUF3392 family protein [Pseudomonas duriflava]TWI58385.1 uncharacterized protein DUF3392 [Pseudomonas duriflava]